MTAFVLLGFVCVWAIRTWIVQPFYIPSSSMEPTLRATDRILVDKTAYTDEMPATGDVVVFRPAADERAYVKRVVAVPGQTVDVRNGRLTVDGREVIEPYSPTRVTEPGMMQLPVTVPDDHVFVLGDNRTGSEDSRDYGPLPAEDLAGRAFAIYWPYERATLIGGAPWTE